jgi:peptidoglycan/LPS O-acetylase OafA/YrhL
MHADSPRLLDALRRRNSLNAIRLILAALVLVAHSWPLTGRGEGPTFGGQNAGTVAVAGFFAISGYLITGSRLNLPVVRYAWSRFLRIYPGYWVVLAVTGLVFAPLVSAIAGEHWTLRAGLDYWFANWTTRLHDHTVHGTLLDVPFGAKPDGGVWNGSIWTLRFEITWYVLIVVLLAVPRIGKSPWWMAAVLAVTSLGTVADTTLSAIDNDLRNTVYFGAPFVAGALLRLLGERVRVSGWLAALAAVACVLAAAVGHFYALGALPLAYLLLWLGAVWDCGVGRETDISYGVYIYAFPVQQMLADLRIGVDHVALFLLLSALGTVPLAFASWFGVERPLMRLKRVTPGRLPGRLQARLPGWAGLPGWAARFTGLRRSTTRRPVRR